MCRNIKPLFNFDPPVTPEEVRAASLQFVRKISGFTKPSQANADAFDAAVEEIAGVWGDYCSRWLPTRRPRIAKKRRGKQNCAQPKDTETSVRNKRQGGGSYSRALAL